MREEGLVRSEERRVRRMRPGVWRVRWPSEERSAEDGGEEKVKRVERWK